MNGENKDILRVAPEVGKAVLFYNQLRKSHEKTILPEVIAFLSHNIICANISGWKLR
jgi:hypothetical protein